MKRHWHERISSASRSKNKGSTVPSCFDRARKDMAHCDYLTGKLDITLDKIQCYSCNQTSLATAIDNTAFGPSSQDIEVRMRSAGVSPISRKTTVVVINIPAFAFFCIAFWQRKLRHLRYQKAFPADGPDCGACTSTVVNGRRKILIFLRLLRLDFVEFRVLFCGDFIHQ
jgi:hypothetical protein